MARQHNDWEGMISTMRYDAGLGTREVARMLGHSPTWLTACLSNYRNGQSPRVDTLAEIAKVCGYELHLTGHGRDIRIQP